MRRWLNFLRFPFVVLSMLTFTATALLTQTYTISAQDPIPLPTPPGEEEDTDYAGEGPTTPLTPEEEAEQLNRILSLEAYLSSFTPADFRIAYLVSDDPALQGAAFTTETITRLTSALPFGTWEAFSAEHAAQPFDFVLLHESMLAQVDRDWAYQAFRDEVIFIGLNVTAGQIADLVGSTCVKDNPPDPNIPEEWDWIYAFGYGIRLEDPQYYEAAKQSLIENCHRDIDTAGTAITGGYRLTTMPLIKPEWVDTLPRLVVAYAYHGGKIPQVPWP